MFKKVVMGLSGGMDSATLLGYLLSREAEVHCCSFHYGAKHNKYENLAANNVLQFYRENGFGINKTDFDLHHIFQYMQSNLLEQGGAIPEGHYNDENMKLTVVPGRNTIFISIMLGLAQSIGADAIAIGVHKGDHAIYPDCREEYIKAMCEVVDRASEGKVQLIAPLLYEDKTSILRLGYMLQPKVPYKLTRTCYKDQPVSCGKCGSCTERLEAFKNVGKPDPIQYE